MSIESDSDEAFDEEELADGFDEETIDGDEDEELGLDDDAEVVGDDADAVSDEESDDDDEPFDEDSPAPAAVVEDDDDLADDADVELALDQVLAETILRTSIVDDDDDGPVEVDPTADPLEAILPKQDDEFRCASCRLLKKMSQLADADKTLCRDCV